MPVQSFSTPLDGRSPVELCIGILNGRFKTEQDDREVQMSACYFLATNATEGDEEVIRALECKLNDARDVGQNVFDNERGYIGSHFYVS
jgi:hypothetical protein